MPDTRITDFTHLLDFDGKISRYSPARRLAEYFAAIVACVTGAPDGSRGEIEVKCRRRPNRSPCPGRIHARFEPGTSGIAWHCPECGDGGQLHHWQNTQWDKGGRGELPVVDKVTYRRGMLSDFDENSVLDATVLEGSAITRDIVVAIHDNELLGASGEYGNPRVGDPAQYDQLMIEHSGDVTEIVVYNRAIMLLYTKDEFYKQVHRVCCVIEKATNAT